jgi:hypothetical protein
LAVRVRDFLEAMGQAIPPGSVLGTVFGKEDTNMALHSFATSWKCFIFAKKDWLWSS